eukprot:354862-Chlamydomonas_euryale.AAC.3
MAIIASGPYHTGAGMAVSRTTGYKTHFCQRRSYGLAANAGYLAGRRVVQDGAGSGGVWYRMARDQAACGTGWRGIRRRVVQDGAGPGGVAAACEGGSPMLLMITLRCFLLCPSLLRFLLDAVWKAMTGPCSALTGVRPHGLCVTLLLHVVQLYSCCYYYSGMGETAPLEIKDGKRL